MGTIFSDADIRVHLGDSMATEYVWNVGKAFAEWLPEDGSVAVVTSQIADKTAVTAFVEGLLLQGRTVIDAGVGGQQAVYTSLSENKSAGAALLDYSAAQNLAVISLFDSHGAAISMQTGLNEIGELVNAGNFLPAAEKGTLLKSE
ncbi:MAG: hypothetical protein H6797_05735 [Candidatus Nomurabacteria bacterium]|nr:MAG: hypothetical protein H6797_05735 [Candidatus Nomurabacteria bacterium]